MNCQIQPHHTLLVCSMVRILDGSPEHGAHIWAKSGISSCEGRSVTSTESSSPILFSEKTYFTLYVSNMF